MIGEGDELADAVALGNAARCVGKHHGVKPESPQNAHGEGDLLRCVALIEVDAALHDYDRNAAQHAGNDAARMAHYRGLREMRNLGVGDQDGVGNGVGHRAQAGAEHDADVGREEGEFCAKKRGGFSNLIEVGHG